MKANKEFAAMSLTKKKKKKRKNTAKMALMYHSTKKL